MEKDKQSVNFYEFWVWQYTKRNSTTTKVAGEIISIGNVLVSAGLLVNADDAACAYDYPGDILRIATTQENELLKSASRTHTKLMEITGYNLGEVITENPTSKDIIESAGATELLYSYLPENLKFCHQDYGVKVGEIITDENATQLGEIDKFRQFERYIGLGVIVIDFESPLEALLGEIKDTIMVLRNRKRNISVINDPELLSLCKEIHAVSGRTIYLNDSNINTTIQGKWEELSVSINDRCGENASFHRDTWSSSGEKYLGIHCDCSSCANASVCIYGISSRFTKAKTFIKSSRASYNPERFAPRAIGLWLWDYVQEHGGKKKRGVVQEAINSMKDLLKPLCDDLGYYAESPDRVLQGLFNRTEKCIEACEVLSFK